MDFLYNNFLADFFAWCLRGMESWVGNYVVATVILTIGIRLAMLPLDLKQRANQEKMSALAPEMASLQKRYANDPQQLQRKTQELYRKMHVNPAMGCLPMLISLPILFAFFGAMNLLASERTVGIMLSAAQYGPETVELPRFFWVHNFWQPDSGLAPILPSSSEFLQFVQRNANYITPQALQLLRYQDILSFADGTVGINVERYSDLVRQIVEANGVNYIENAAGQMIAEYNNGWFILPVLSGAALLLQQRTAMKMQNQQPAASAEAAEAQGCTNKVMLWFFPLFSIYICCTTNTAFALYWFVSSIYAFTQSQVVTALRKRKANRQQLVPVRK